MQTLLAKYWHWHIASSLGSKLNLSWSLQGAERINNEKCGAALTYVTIWVTAVCARRGLLRDVQTEG
eukprot:5154404-Amphidinium_carterae.1